MLLSRVTFWKCDASDALFCAAAIRGFAQVCSRGVTKEYLLFQSHDYPLSNAEVSVSETIARVLGPLTHAGAESIVRRVAGEGTKQDPPAAPL